MRELNKAVPQGLGEAKKRYIEQAIALDPGINKEELEELWGNYVSELRQYPSFSDAQYEDFDTWRSKNSPEQIEQIVLEKDPKFIVSLQKKFEEHPEETDFETYKARKLEEKARDIYNSQKDLSVMSSQFGMAGESTNPLSAYNEAKKQFAEMVAEEYKAMIPESTPSGSQTVTLFIGFTGGWQVKIH